MGDIYLNTEKPTEKEIDRMQCYSYYLLWNPILGPSLI